MPSEHAAQDPPPKHEPPVMNGIDESPRAILFYA
jgi:hypothetical protein